MKKIPALLLVLAIVLSLGACAGPEEISSQANKGGEVFSPVYPYAAVPIYNAQNEKIGELEQSGKISQRKAGLCIQKGPETGKRWNITSIRPPPGKV